MLSAHVIGQRGVVIDERREVDAAIGQLAEDKIGQRRDGVERAGNQRGLDRIGAIELDLELSYFVGEAHRKHRGAQRAHGIARYQRNHAAEAVHQAAQVDVLAGKIEFDARLARIGRFEGDAAARGRLEDRGIKIGDLRAERAPRRLAVAGDEHVARHLSR